MAQRKRVEMPSFFMRLLNVFRCNRRSCHHASLFVHSDGCVFPEHVRQVHARVKGPKELVWAAGEQIDFYDRPEQVGAAVEAVTRWFAQTLGVRATELT